MNGVLTVSQHAVSQIAEVTGAGRAEGLGLRIELLAGGCCGTYYSFSLGLPEPDDITLQTGDARVFLAPAVAGFLQDARLDYGARLKPPRFRILRNPNTPTKCPCGRSFGSPFPGKSTAQCQAYVPMRWEQER